MYKILLFVFIFSLYGCRSEKEQIKFENRGGIYIPVNVDGKLYPFLFDTGSAVTLFSDGLVRELGNRVSVQRKDSIKFLVVAKKDHRSIKYSVYDSTVLKIGDISVNCAFVSNRNEDSNILGMDVISRFNWLFNFQDTTVVLSGDAIRFQSDGWSDLSFEYLTNKGAMVVPVNLNDSISKYLVLDTGWGFDPISDTTDISLDASDLVINLSVGDSNRVVDELGNIGGLNYLGTFRNNNKIMIFPSLKIGNISMEYVSSSFSENPYFELQEQAGLQGLLSYGFVVNRFSYLQISPKQKRVSLYSNGEEHVSYTRRVERFYHHCMEKLYRQHGLPYSGKKEE